MSRMVLVVMVTALGITIPTWPEVQAWLGRAHSWTAARLAELDPSPSRGRAWELIAPWPEDPVPVVGLIEPDAGVSSIADELNRLAGCVDLPAGATVARARPKVAQAQGAPVLGIVSERCSAAKAKCPDVPAPAIPLLDGELLPEPSPQSTPMPLVRRRVRTRLSPIGCMFSPSRASSSEPIEPVADSATDVAAALNRASDGIQAGVIADSWTKAAFEPIAPAPARSDDVAAALNRAAEGLDLVMEYPVVGGGGADRSRMPDPVTPAKSQEPMSATSPSSGVARALRLTRAALNAWTEVLTTPAIVQVSRR